MKDHLIPLDNDCNNQVIKKWHRFVKFGEKPTGLSEKVVHSWERSKELKIDAFGGKSNIILTAEELDYKLEQYKQLINISLPYINNIVQTIKGLGYVVFLTDSETNILYVSGDKSALEDFRDIYNFKVGASWSERAVGTTAVSMVISDNNAVPFMADEKYCLELKKRACSAVPIRNIEGEIIAILGIAASFPTPNYQLSGILLAAEMAIENQLRMMKMNEKLCLVNEYYEAIFNSVSDAIVTVDNRGVITELNQMATELLREDKNNLIGKDAKDVLGFYPVILDVLKTGREFASNNKLMDTKDKKMRYNIKKVIPILNHKDTIDGCINILGISKGKKLFRKKRFVFEDIKGRSKEIQKAISEGKVASNNDFNVLIVGESGTGKEVFAQAIHNASARASGPFVAINCGAIPKELIESEFFGFEAGAFTGANKNGGIGKFEQANGGSIFLDEIGEMPKDLQVRLLRVLQEREFSRIGGNKNIMVDVRVIAATNKSLVEEVNNHQFRSDLFWRLNVIQINIPTLSKRKRDIPILLEHFMKKYSQGTNQKYILDKSVRDILLSYQWPGNVRELENVAEYILAFCDSSLVLPKHLPDYLMASDKVHIADASSLQETEKQFIHKVLNECGGNITQAAKRLGISRPTLYKKLKNKNIS